MADGSLNTPGVDPDRPLDEVLNELLANIAPLSLSSVPAINGQNSNLGGALFDILRIHTPRWYQVASEAYIAMYCWHGTTDARPLLQPLALTLINQTTESLSIIYEPWDVEFVSIMINNRFHVTSLNDPVFMDLLKKAIAAAQGAFYARTMEVVRYLLLPSHTAPWQHPGIIPSENLVTPEQISYVNSLVIWSPRTGYNLWHDFRADEDGVMMLHWFDRHSLKYLMDTVHFAVGSPGYLYIQELYANLDAGGEEWGPLTMATFHSTTWILAAIHVYLWADVLGNQRFSTERFTTNRRDAIIEKQAKISIFLKRILRKRVPGLTLAQSEVACIALHRFMHTDPNRPFLI